MPLMAIVGDTANEDIRNLGAPTGLQHMWLTTIETSFRLELRIFSQSIPTNVGPTV